MIYKTKLCVSIPDKMLLWVQDFKGKGWISLVRSKPILAQIQAPPAQNKTL